VAKCRRGVPLTLTNVCGERVGIKVVVALTPLCEQLVGHASERRHYRDHTASLTQFAIDLMDDV
jgi:hypothetical protein